jgi:hypothetical protein
MDEPPDKELLFKDLFKIQAVAEIISDVESMSGSCPYNSENPAWYIVVGSAPANSFFYLLLLPQTGISFLAILYHKQVPLSQAVSDGTISDTVAAMLQSCYQRVSSLAECKMHPCTKSQYNIPRGLRLEEHALLSLP